MSSSKDPPFLKKLPSEIQNLFQKSQVQDVIIDKKGLRDCIKKTLHVVRDRHKTVKGDNLEKHFQAVYDNVMESIKEKLQQKLQQKLDHGNTKADQECRRVTSIQEDAGVLLGLTKDLIRAVKIKFNPDCPICLDKVVEGQASRCARPGAEHLMHLQCSRQLEASQQRSRQGLTCPVCRQTEVLGHFSEGNVSSTGIFTAIQGARPQGARRRAETPPPRVVQHQRNIVPPGPIARNERQSYKFPKVCLFLFILLHVVVVMAMMSSIVINGAHIPVMNHSSADTTPTTWYDDDDDDENLGDHSWMGFVVAAMISFCSQGLRPGASDVMLVMSVTCWLLGIADVTVAGVLNLGNVHTD
jgi:hypothetical protein